MKAVIILILSFLLFSYSINAEEKNGAITEPVKNSEIKVLEERINGNEKQIKALKDELAFSKSTEKLYLLGAVLLGAVIGFIFTEISARLRRKEERIDKQKTLEDSIVADSVKYIFKIRDMIDNLIIEKQHYISLEKTDSPAATKRYSKLMEYLDEDMRQGLRAEKSFHTLQLRRLKKQEICKKFNAIVNVQSTLFQLLFEKDTFDGVKEARKRWTVLTNEFTSYYVEISKA